MKKIGWILLCLAVFLLTAGGAVAWMYFSPRGVLHPEGPADVMQRYMDGRDRADWQAEFLRTQAPPVTEFESGDEVAARLFETAVADNAFTFREEPVADPDSEARYIVSAGADLFRAVLRYENGNWAVKELEPLSRLTAESRTVAVTLPSDASLRINGIPVSPDYITEEDILYPEMTEVELRFGAVPHRVRYEIPGIYEEVTVDARSAGSAGLTLLFSDGTTWDLIPADAGAYARVITAPQEAVVDLAGARITSDAAAATRTMPTRLDIPEELADRLPVDCVYTFGGLYTPDPAVSAVLPDGTVLEAEEVNGSVTFSLPGAEELYQANHERVEGFLRQLCEYGSGRTLRATPGNYCVPGSPVETYIRHAIGSLQWTVNVTLTIRETRSFGYVALGDDAFLCHGYVDANTSTWYQKKDLSLGYEMLWVNRNGVWLLQDMAFEEPAI